MCPLLGGATAKARCAGANVLASSSPNCPTYKVHSAAQRNILYQPPEWLTLRNRPSI